MTNEPRSAKDMTDNEYAAARKLAMQGKLPPPVKAEAQADDDDASDTGTETNGNTSSTNEPPRARQYGDAGRGILDLAESSYQDAKARAIAEADGGRSPTVGYSSYRNR